MATETGQIGVAFVTNGISADQRLYLALAERDFFSVMELLPPSQTSERASEETLKSKKDRSGRLNFRPDGTDNVFSSWLGGSTWKKQKSVKSV